MPRSRNIKPGFFKNEQLIECSPWARLLFAGLWTLADRRGIVEDRPKRIKMELFPADNVDVDALIAELASVGLAERVTAGSYNVVYLPGFQRHQNPHKHEQPSEIPWPDSMSTVQAQCEHGASNDEDRSSPADSLNLIPDSCNRIPESPPADADAAPARNNGAERQFPKGQRFEEWWQHYPKKRGKKPAREIWKRKGLDAQADELIDDVCARVIHDEQWGDGYIPDPERYLKHERWHDEYQRPKRAPASRPDGDDTPAGKAKRQAWDYLRSRGLV